MLAQSLSDKLYQQTVERLQKLISIPSFSKEEHEAAAFMEALMHEEQIAFQRKGNNIWAKNKYYDPSKPTLLLNSHIDTVKPNHAYTLDPFAYTFVFPNPRRAASLPWVWRQCRGALICEVP